MKDCGKFCANLNQNFVLVPTSEYSYEGKINKHFIGKTGSIEKKNFIALSLLQIQLNIAKQNNKEKARPTNIMNINLLFASSLLLSLCSLEFFILTV